MADAAAATATGTSAVVTVHVVLLKVKPETTDEQRAALEEGVKMLSGKIPEIRSLTTGSQLAKVDDGRNAAMGLVASFATPADYQVYATHADHVAFIKGTIMPIAAGRTALQFSADPACLPTTAGDGTSVMHAVLLTLKPETTEQQKAAIIEGLRELPSKIPEIQTYCVGQQIDAIDDGRNATVGIIATFASAADYQTYAAHAEHIAVIKGAILPVLAEGGRAALQFVHGAMSRI
eukprot:gnl/TRDRNA2_/TRDRNA2_200007_c0_seq1.p1 gnl/TRDRNA2_/TRDRNA2_200007_c0~~gnl/TRDRNA2_/TRDRNA2_200007_c0_seq1.p1  ORF type:complete len:235 (-),score=48.04 gnl/TRDRNA2_/TRDRNA2_200007_c0_seq1:293-997(-)